MLQKGILLLAIIYQKVLLMIISPLSMEKTFMTDQFDPDVKRYEETRELTIGQNENYTTGCLLDHEYIKNQSFIID